MILIDGYNLLFCIVKPDSTKLEEQRDALVADLDRYAARTNQAVRIFFDRGGPRRGKRGRVEIVHVENRSSADERIVDALEGTPDRTRYRVVSSDREIRRAAESRRFEAVESAAFWKEVLAALAPPEGGEPPQKQDGIGPGEADYWMKQFGLDDKEKP